MEAGAPWVVFGADRRASAVPWLTTEEYTDGVLYLVGDLHKETFYDLCACINSTEIPAPTKGKKVSEGITNISYPTHLPVEPKKIRKSKESRDLW